MSAITMDHKPSKPNTSRSGASNRSAPAVLERRDNPRLPFTAGATAIEPSSQAEIDAHTTDISNAGCYVDTMSPFPAGTEMHLRLTKNGKSFHTKARVIYCQAGMGMGLLFTHIAPAQRDVLEKWLSELQGESSSDVSLDHNAGTSGYAKASNDAERYAIQDLVLLLTNKHLLTEEEGETILRRFTE